MKVYQIQKYHYIVSKFTFIHFDLLRKNLSHTLPSNFGEQYSEKEVRTAGSYLS